MCIQNIRLTNFQENWNPPSPPSVRINNSVVLRGMIDMGLLLGILMRLEMELVQLMPKQVGSSMWVPDMADMQKPTSWTLNTMNTFISLSQYLGNTYSLRSTSKDIVSASYFALSFILFLSSLYLSLPLSIPPLSHFMQTPCSFLLYGMKLLLERGGVALHWGRGGVRMAQVYTR